MFGFQIYTFENSSLFGKLTAQVFKFWQTLKNDVRMTGGVICGWVSDLEIRAYTYVRHIMQMP